MQNPALGAYLLWRYGQAFQNSLTAEASHFVLHFLVLPICFHQETLEQVNGTLTQSGLGKFCEKLGEKKEELLAIHDRCRKLKELTLKSMAVGVRSQLLNIEYDTCQVRALAAQSPKIEDRIKVLGKGAEKLGAWFRELTPAQIIKSLRINL